MDISPPNGRESGIALVGTLLTLSVLLMLILSLIVVSRNTVFKSGKQQRDLQLLYLAEAGLATAQLELERDLGWPGVTDASLPDFDGIYSVTFGPQDSVNNIGVPTPADSHRGPGTVPANSALLVVRAEYGSQTKVLESIVFGRGNGIVAGNAIMATGRVTAEDDLFIRGVESLTESTSASAGLQSNQGGSDAVSLTSGVIEGDVSVASSSSSAISLGSTSLTGAEKVNNYVPIQRVDIAHEIASHAGPSWSYSGTGPNTLGPGDHYVSSDVVLNGDLVLEPGANLYVDGDLEVNGSISGTGSVFVYGTTTLKGDSTVAANDDSHVALNSLGSVSLTGFDGTQFLAAVGTSDPSVQQALNDVQFALNDIKTVSQTQNLIGLGGNSIVEQISTSLAGGRSSPGSQVYRNDNGLGQDTLGTLLTAVQSEPAGPTRDFLVDRIGEARDFFLPAGTFYTDSAGGDESSVTAFLDSGESRGLLDAVNDAIATNIVPSLHDSTSNLIQETSFDKLGSSFFKGRIYSNESIYVNNEITILGTVVVDNDGSGQTRVFDGVTVNPGELYLGRRSSITYVDDFLQDSLFNSTEPQLLERGTWIVD